MATLNALFLARHPEPYAAPYLIEIIEQALMRAKCSVHSLGNNDDLDKIANSLPKLGVIVADWDFYSQSSSYRRGVSRFQFLRNKFGRDIPIIVVSTSYVNPTTARAEGGSEFIRIEMYAKDDSRYIAGNVSNLVVALDSILYDHLKLTPSTSTPQLHRYRTLEDRKEVPALYRDVTGFEPPAKKLTAPAKKPGTVAAESSASSGTNAPLVNRHRPRNSLATNYTANLASEMMKRKKAREAALAAQAVNPVSTEDGETNKSAVEDEKASGRPITKTVLASMRMRHLARR